METPHPVSTRTHATSGAETAPQTAAGKVLWHFTMSLDGFVAGPGHTMDWMTGFSFRPGLVEEYAATTGAVLGGRDGWDAFPDAGAVYGGAWQGPLFVLTHHPEDAPPAAGVTFLSCDAAEAVRIAVEAAGGKNVEVFSPTIGRQLLERGLIDEIDLHIVPVLLGDGIRLFDHPGGAPVRLERLDDGDRTAAVNVRYRPLTTAPSQSVR
ncbi:dihydrofolate reductase family protein [Streptomyces pseudovenezuelae]|uniref:dihydrofolate reductase family protein n=1 Tax=Streptomyces pseudovenezuelae TaxID=67350 RepID=UPI0036E80D3F